MKRAFVVATLFLALAAPLAATGQETKDAPPAVAAEGRLAPEIFVSHWIGGDGRTSIADFRGEVVLLEFWGTT
jgi:hypothetical protein